MRRATGYRIAGAVLLAAFSLIFAQREVSMAGNEASRFAVVCALGERGVFYLDQTPFRTIDRVMRLRHVYSDKPLPLAWSVGMFYRQWHRLTGMDFTSARNTLIYVIDALFGFAVNFLLFLWMFNALRRIRRGGLPLKFILALLGVLGTWIGTYSTVLNNHTPAALALFGLFVLAGKFAGRPDRGGAFGCGLAAGALGLLELPLGAIFGLCSVVLAAVAAPRGRRLVFAALAAGGGALMLAFFFGLNYYAYADIRPLYIVSGGSWSPPSPLRDGAFAYAFHALIGARGVFSYQPFLLLGIPGLLILWPKLDAARRILCVGMAAAFAFYACFTDEFGGWAYGFRYYIPLIPLLWYFGAAWVLRWKRALWKTALLTLLLLCGAGTALVGTDAPYCVAYEGYRSPKGHFTRTIQSTFAGNLLNLLHRHAPDSRLMDALIDRYGEENVNAHLFWSAVNMDRNDPELGVSGREQTLKALQGSSRQHAGQ